MALESATYIDDLVTTNPVGSDDKSQGDDHIRLLKSTIKATFPNVTGIVSPTHSELNYVDVTNPGTSEASKALVTDSNGSIDINAHDAATYGLKLGGTLVTATAAELNYSDGVTSNIQTQITANVNPAGMVSPYAGSSAPTGWLLCQGAAVSRTTYATLFAIVGTTYGVGDGSTTFNLPDLGGRTVAGKEATATRLTSASAGGVDGGTLGASGGVEEHQLTISEMPAHTHTVGNAPRAYAGGADCIAEGGVYNTSSSGGDTAHTNTQPTIVLNYIIKT